MKKYIIKNCPCYTSKGGYYDCWANQDTWCENITDCVIKQIIKLCKEVKEKDPIVVERDKQTGKIISIGGFTENPIYDFAQKILEPLEIEEVNE